MLAIAQNTKGWGHFSTFALFQEQGTNNTQHCHCIKSVYFCLSHLMVEYSTLLSCYQVTINVW